MSAGDCEAVINTTDESSKFSVIIKWSGKEYVIDEEMVCEEDTVLHLKHCVYKLTGVLPQRQKLMGIKVKGKPATDDAKLYDLKLKANSKIMMIGSKEEDIQNMSNVDTSVGDGVVNDLDIPDNVDVPLSAREEFLAKVERRVKELKVTVFNEPRVGKKLLVLDIDYTLFDHRSVAEHIDQLMRPYLHEFLTSAYQDYDIVIWSATGMKWIEVKMRQMGVMSNPNYKIAFFLDSSAMIQVHTPQYGLLDVKPLGVIWGKFEQYNSKNTIMFDDIRRNFLMNPQNGLRIKAFRDALRNRETDRELKNLAVYLKKIAEMDDLSKLNHRHWHRFVSNE
ncbi:ubiquitin-like domain-containing CTD phosphatase 1 isoform X2 [Leptotrombidium deliense]|uniref:Ubiquitin-like domain-containing CTD phosphatase 1 n=1 Tax=Leptotrombidium deliense TaxID=299467 RepID=A0A443SRP8_9ACAR|nr:ubiquitin-like domain-containing CTD phosphatase 1 isoform X2 [Leptotrombidium deliense]